VACRDRSRSGGEIISKAMQTVVRTTRQVNEVDYEMDGCGRFEWWNICLF
jgi:hypothetical protein